MEREIFMNIYGKWVFPEKNNNGPTSRGVRAASTRVILGALIQFRTRGRMGYGEINEISWQTSWSTRSRAINAATRRRRERERDKLLHVVVNEVSASFFLLQSRKASIK